jgi:hypothetical protein
MSSGGDAPALRIYDLEEFVEYAGPYGSAFTSLRNDELGITFGEMLVGQMVSYEDGYDVVSGTPTVPLAVDTTVEAAFGVNILWIFSSTVIDGIGMVGFPSIAAIGDGAMTVLFDRDQHVIAFDIVGSNRGPLHMQFFDRAGGHLGDLSFESTRDTTYVVGSIEPNIAAVTFSNFDWGGLAFDNFLFQPGPADRLSLCQVPGPVEVPRSGAWTAVPLDALLSEEVDPAWYGYRWVTTCPDGYFEDTNSLSPTLYVNSSDACQIQCTATLLVDDGFEVDVCSAQVLVGADPPPEVVCPQSVVVESDGHGNETELQTWLNSVATGDDRLVTTATTWVDGPCDGTGTLHVTWTIAGSPGNDCDDETQCSATFTIQDTTSPVLEVDTTPIVVTDELCSGLVEVALPTAAAYDIHDPNPYVTSDAPDLFPSGRTTTVTYSATDACLNASSAAVGVTVLHNAGVEVRLVEHVVPARGRRVADSIVSGALVSAYEIGRDSCAEQAAREGLGRSWKTLETILTECTAVQTAVTDAQGMVVFSLLVGDYVLIAQIDIDGDGAIDELVGHSIGNLQCGKWHTQELRVLVHDDPH